MTRRILVFCLSLLLVCCSTQQQDQWTAPPAEPGVVTWLMVDQKDISEICGISDKYHNDVVGCFKMHGNECIIITRPPQNNDYSLLDTLQHEVAHCQGWKHPPYPNT